MLGSYLAVYVKYLLDTEDSGKHEIDVFACRPEGLNFAFELKKRHNRKTSGNDVRNFRQKLLLLKELKLNETAVLHGIFLSQDGFTTEAEGLMKEWGIMYADFRQWFGEEF